MLDPNWPQHLDIERVTEPQRRSGPTRKVLPPIEQLADDAVYDVLTRTALSAHTNAAAASHLLRILLDISLPPKFLSHGPRTGIHGPTLRSRRARTEAPDDLRASGAVAGKPRQCLKRRPRFNASPITAD